MLSLVGLYISLGLQRFGITLQLERNASRIGSQAVSSLGVVCVEEALYLKRVSASPDTPRSIHFRTADYGDQRGDRQEACWSG
jgi:hypothetical protein